MVSKRPPASSLRARLQSPPPSAGLTTWVVYDAAEGNNEELQVRWEGLNLLRDRLTETLHSREPRNSVVFLITVTRMPEIARHAPDLLAVSQVITVSEEPFAVDPRDTSMMERFQQSCRELETRYGLSTHELARRLLEAASPSIFSSRGREKPSPTSRCASPGLPSTHLSGSSCSTWTRSARPGPIIRSTTSSSPAARGCRRSPTGACRSENSSRSDSWSLSPRT